MNHWIVRMRLIQASRVYVSDNFQFIKKLLRLPGAIFYFQVHIQALPGVQNLENGPFGVILINSKFQDFLQNIITNKKFSYKPQYTYIYGSVSSRWGFCCFVSLSWGKYLSTVTKSDEVTHFFQLLSVMQTLWTLETYQPFSILMHFTALPCCEVHNHTALCFIAGKNWHQWPS